MIRTTCQHLYSYAFGKSWDEIAVKLGSLFNIVIHNIDKQLDITWAVVAFDMKTNTSGQVMWDRGAGNLYCEPLVPSIRPIPTEFVILTTVSRPAPNHVPVNCRAGPWTHRGFGNRLDTICPFSGAERRSDLFKRRVGEYRWNSSKYGVSKECTVEHYSFNRMFQTITVRICIGISTGLV